jgi:hypothetical protein
MALMRMSKHEKKVMGAVLARARAAKKKLANARKSGKQIASQKKE